MVLKRINDHVFLLRKMLQKICPREKRVLSKSTQQFSNIRTCALFVVVAKRTGKMKTSELYWKIVGE